MSETPRRESAKERRRRQIGEFHDALVGAKTMAEACKIAGVSARTGARWIRTDTFAEIYSERRKATLHAASGLLKAGSIGSIETLVSIAIDKEASSTARVAAAKVVVDAMLKISELRDLEERLERLEQAAGGSEKNA